MLWPRPVSSGCHLSRSTLSCLATKEEKVCKCGRKLTVSLPEASLTLQTSESGELNAV